MTGHATEFVVDTAFGAKVRRLCELQMQRWSGLLFCGLPATVPVISKWNPETVEDDGYPDIVTFSSGPAMESFWEENGYALDHNGEGPFSIFYRLNASMLSARLPEIVEVDNPEVRRAVGGATLLLSAFYVVTLITPDDPAEEAFSRSVLSDFRHAFAE